ncbi:MAG: VCBS repeat-containing protein, partial [Bryobacteraceae bacterium]
MNPLPTFREHVIANDLKGGYQVAAVDLTGDGRSDLIALASGMSELAWYENPGWNRHVIATGLSSPINVA